MSKIELKACPLCGGCAQLSVSHSTIDGWPISISCNTCLVTVTRNDRHEVISLWNKRTPEPAPKLDAAVIERAMALCDALDEALPHISDAIVIATMHHCPYTGPTVDGQLAALKEALDAREGG